ncbi:MAG: lytic transglycosylase domain-containing protein [Thiotrichaceae bacterium]|nr:lytic transglycosylase domain-containing protein [Thiotrichaceae bacterium]
MKVLIKTFECLIVFIKYTSLPLLMLFSTVVFAAPMTTIYVYEEPSGSHIITSTKEVGARNTLIKTYKVPTIAVKSRRMNRSKPAYKTSTGLKTKTKRREKGCNKRSMRNRESQYKRSIHVYSRIYQVDSELVRAIIKNESCFRLRAKSHVGAMGLMQLMPGTAKDMMISDPWNPEQNIQAGVRYIGKMLRTFKGNKRLAIAAYNAGPGNVRKYKGIPPFKETRRYVRNVMADYKRNKLKARRITRR